MRIFVSGATGVLGRRVVRLLYYSGHAVVGLSRSAANTEWLSQNGAEAREGDLFDGAQMRRITAGCDAILHLATAIPTKSRTTVADWQTNDRIRIDGTRNLVEAALDNGCRLYLQQSVTLLYGEQNGNWVDESTPIPTQQPRILQSALAMERIVQDAVDARALPAVILRCGSFYSHDSAQTQAMLQLAQRGMFPVVGDGRYYWNPLHADDAAATVVAAVQNHEAGLGQVFNVVDDEPVMYKDLLHFLAEALAARRPFHLPRWLARVMLGDHVVEAIFASARCRNQRLKETFGWRPQFPTYRQGYPAVIDRWRSS